MAKNIRKKLIALCVIMAIAVSIMPILPLRVSAAAVPVAGFGKALRFSDSSSGSNGVVEIASSTAYDITNNFTIELWVQGTTADTKYLAGRYSSLNGDNQWAVLVEPNNTNAYFYIRNNKYTSLNKDDCRMPLPDPGWHHIAYTYDGTTFSGYVDGVRKVSLSRTDLSLPTTANNIYIGGQAGGITSCGRCIDEFRIWNVSLSEATIKEWMYHEVDSTHPNYSSLICYYKLNEGFGSTVADSKNGTISNIINSGTTQWVDSTIRTWTTNEDTAVTGCLVGSDTDGADSLNYEIVNPGTMGTASIINGNQFRYVPNADANGSDTFTYRVTDGVNTSNTQSVSITINPVNDPPEVSNVQISGTALNGEVLTGSYTYSDVESNADSSTFQWYRSNDAVGMGKTLISGATGKTYTVTSYDYGKYLSFKVTPKDALGATGTAVESSLMEVRCKVSFNSNGGSAVSQQSISYNSTATEPDDPSKTGYTFAGWYSDSSLTSVYNFATPVTVDITLYAKWNINSYIVSFESNGGSAVGPQHINYNSVATQPGNPSKTGYTFVGWYSDIGLTSPYDFATPVTGDITLYAKWTINNYTVRFDSNGGSNITSQHIDYNSMAIEPATPPTKTGYTFAGWYSDIGLTNAYDFATPVTADITLYARWTNLGPTGTVIINGGNALTNNASVELNLSASDPGGDTVTDMCFSDDGVQWAAWKPYMESESYTLPSGDGSKTVYVKFRDSAGSIGAVASASIELDTIPPVIAGVANNTAYNVDVIPSFTEGVATLSRNGGSADSFTSGTPVSAEGTYDLEVTDAAGNTAAISFSIDKTAPSGALSINNGEENTTSQSVSLAITSTDGNGSGQLQMRFSNDGSTWSPWEAAAADKQWAIQSTYGTATVYMQLKDKAGNISGNITDTILYRSVPVSDGSTIDGVEDTNLLLSANDFAYSNPDGNLLNKIMIVSLPLHGTLKLGGMDVSVSQEVAAADLGAFVFIPESNWNGITYFAWKGSDGINYSVQEAEIIINIAPVNDAPVANDGSLTTNAGMAGRGTLSASDLEGDSLSYSIEAQGSKGEAVVTDSTTGAYTYTPYDGEFGSDSFTFKVNDGSVDSNTATVTVNIIPSGVADLSALSVREGVLTPEFEVNTMDYFVSVSNLISSLTVTASVYDIYSTVEIDNMSVTDAVYGEYSKTISLDVGVNTICIDVTSQDGQTAKTYTITATRAPSYNAELASVNLGIRLTPDFSPDITTYSGTVGNGVGSITLKPVAADSTATIKVNGNVLTGTSAVVALNVGSNSIVIEVTAQDGITKKTYTFNIYRLEASNRDKEDHEPDPINPTPETTPKPAETNAGVDIYINGKAENAGTVTTTNAGGRTTTFVVVDESKLEQNLAGEGNNAVITIPVNTNAEVVVGELNGRMIKNLENKEAVIEIKTGTATYTLPAQQINIDAVSAQFGTQVALQDIKVQIEISQPASETVKAVENMAGQDGFSIVAPPMEFNVRCTYGGRTVQVANFNAFVERSIAIPDNVDPNKITTGIIIDPDGTVRHVPTRITIVDGKYYAVINSLSNSLYSVIWHPVEFKDAAGHWAEKDIDDMGSRLVMGGAGGKFEPDRDITRAEFTAAVVRALGLKPGMGKNLFEDVKPSDWYCEYIETAYEYGIISGYGNRFGPADKITRAQAAVIIERAMRITGLNVELLDGDVKAIIADFGGAGQVSAYAEYGMAACVKIGIVTIGNEKLMAPKENITRAEAAVIIRRLLQKSNLI